MKPIRNLCAREVHGCPRCRQVQRVLDAFLDGETDPVTNALVADHLRGCRDCASEFEALQRLKARVTSTRPAVARSDIDRLRARVLARIVRL